MLSKVPFRAENKISKEEGNNRLAPSSTGRGVLMLDFPRSIFPPSPALFETSIVAK
jgi:hypothetical protein